MVSLSYYTCLDIAMKLLGPHLPQAFRVGSRRGVHDVLPIGNSLGSFKTSGGVRLQGGGDGDGGQQGGHNE